MTLEPGDDLPSSSAAPITDVRKVGSASAAALADSGCKHGGDGASAGGSGTGVRASERDGGALAGAPPSAVGGVAPRSLAGASGLGAIKTPDGDMVPSPVGVAAGDRGVTGSGGGAGGEGGDSGDTSCSGEVGAGGTGADGRGGGARGGGGENGVSGAEAGGTGGTTSSTRAAPENLLDVIDETLLQTDSYEYQMSLMCLTASNPLRRACIAIVRNAWFDRCIMLLIIANCVQMAAKDPLMDTTTAEYKRVQEFNRYFDTVLMSVFTVEMGIKIIAMGFALHRHAYLRDKWNWIDFTCVVSGWVDLGTTWAGGANGAGALTALRAVRVLRPLRTLTQLPGMKALISCMLASIPQLGNVVGILFFMLSIFGIIGVQLFQGKLRHQCWGKTEEADWGPTGDVCNPWGHPGTYQCPRGFDCRCGASGLPPFAADRSSNCNESDNPNFGINHFDHIVGAFITIFQSITLEGWVDNMYFVQDGVNFDVSWVYFVLVVVFGAFLVVQLFLVVLSDTFSNVSEPEAENVGKNKEYTDEDGDGIMDLSMDGKPWLQRQCYHLVTMPFFRHFITAMIVLNTIAMCCEYFEQPEEEEFVFRCINYALTAIFAVEILAKLIAMGPKNCFRDPFNRFDALVVILSFVEIFLEVAGAGLINLAVLRTFRLLRLVRVIKVMRSLEGLHHIMQALLSSLRSVSSLAVLLLLLVVVFALLGLEVFGGIYTAPPRGRNPNWDQGESPRANFDGFGMACISIFIVLSGENWNEVYFNAAHGLETAYGPGPTREVATVYFLLLFLLGNYVVFNLFVAIILLNIDVVEETQLTEEERAAKIDGPGKVVFAFGQLVHVEDEHADRVRHGPSSPSALRQIAAKPLFTDHRGTEGDGLMQRVSTLASLPIRTLKMSMRDSSDAMDDEKDGEKDREKDGEKDRDFEWPEDTPSDRSLFLFSWSNPVRRACARLVWHPNFDRAILVLIFTSSIALAFDTPDKTETTTRALLVLNWIFTVVFLVEMVMKVVVFGFFAPKGTAYIRNAWNILDFCIVLISVLLLAFEYVEGLSASDFGWLKALRVVRTLRPLRMVTRMAGMKQVVNSLIAAVPPCGNVALLMILFVLIFSIIGVQLFKGKFYSCTDPEHLTKATCETAGERWVNPTFGNFDNVGYGILLLVEMAGLEGWPDVMFTGMSVTAEYHAPVRDDSSPTNWYAVYFIVWIFAGAFLVWNMFVGVVLDTFNQIRKKDDGAAFMTAEQRSWVEAQRTVYAMRPLRQFECPSSNPTRKRIFEFVQGKTFEIVIMTVILLNVVVMMLEWHDKPPAYEAALRNLNFVFTTVFIAELLLKVTGLGLKQYITNAWNAFDAALVAISIIDLTFEVAGTLLTLPINPNILRVLRMFRVVRILRVVKTAKGLRTLLVTLWSSLPALQNVGLLLGLIMFIYAIMGMLMFHDVPFGECLNRHANFTGFWISLLTLFRCSTGESWNCIMHDAMGPDWADNASRCEGDQCGDTAWAAFYFLSYYLLGQAILLNLVIGVILENFSVIGSENKPITVEQLEEFREIWLKYDPKGTYVIPSYHLLPIISQLSHPLGLGGKKPAASRAHLLAFMRKIDIPDHNGEIHFMETITAVANRICGVPLPMSEETRKIAKQADKSTANSKQLNAPEHNAMTSYLVSLLQHRYRNYAHQKRLEMQSGSTNDGPRPALDGAKNVALESASAGSQVDRNACKEAAVDDGNVGLRGSSQRSAATKPSQVVPVE